MDKLDAQVQVRIMDLAEKWMGEIERGPSSEDTINRRSKLFDKAYKAIIKTLTEK